MNPRITTIIVGSIILILGLAGLLVPQFAMAHLLGFAVDPAHTFNAVHGEVRATYGGLFTVMGVYTLLAAMDPSAHRTRITFVGLMWLGACAGRLLGASIDGSPGVQGWLAAVFELIMGGALVAAAWMAGRTPPAQV